MQSDLADKLTVNPWPEDSAPGVIFILDARNRFEQSLLEQWIEQHRPEGISAEQLVVSLADDTKTIDSSALQTALTSSQCAVIAPLRVAWIPSQESIDSGPSIRHLIFGDERRPSARRGRKILKNFPERLHLIEGKPDTRENLKTRFLHQHGADGADKPGAFAGFVARQAALVLDIRERRLQGGRYKVPRFVAEHLRADTNFRQAVRKLAVEKNIKRGDLVKEVSIYMKEMISIPSTFWLDFYARFNSFCLNLGYEDKIVYNQSEVEEMRKLVRNHPCMLLWTHKTYLDGMVIPKVLYENDFPMPHMFGGANMAFAGLGFMLRRSGAIFIRRSFQDNALYKLTLRHYIGYLMEKRFPMNWAFEGTRSRMGKLMPPRYGLLKYVLEACGTVDARNIHIIPISISYDLIRDVEEYATEQTGRGKGAESLSWFIGYIRSLAKPMGKVYMDIGKPVVLDRAPDPDDRLALSKIAFQIAVEANNVTPITFPSLVTMSLLGAAPKALTEEEVVEDLHALLGWAEARNLRISSDFDRAYADQIDGLLGIMIDEGIVTRYDQGPEIVYGIALEQHSVASYYRNTIIHFFVNKAIIELALTKASENEGDGALDVFWAEVEYLRDLFKFEFFYAPSEEFQQEIRTDLDSYDSNWEELIAQGSVGAVKLLNSMPPLVSHATLLTYAEAYSIVVDLVAGMDAGDTLEKEACVSDALHLGHQRYLQRRISSESSIGKLLFSNGFKMLEHRKLTEGGDESVAQARRDMAREIRELLRRLEVIRALAANNRNLYQ
ncbi:MAG: glycerol-3-phosphate 1-O-acyltransferase [Proteobacteria bacterium]|nr:glycerol-3-phosphate 1-O-acyltransferase [Pseudomonadota bacterium]